MNNPFLVLTGSALLLLSLWGGAWLIDFVSPIYNFAAFITSYLIGLAGLLALIFGLIPRKYL